MLTLFRYIGSPVGAYASHGGVNGGIRPLLLTNAQLVDPACTVRELDRNGTRTIVLRALNLTSDMAKAAILNLVLLAGTPTATREPLREVNRQAPKDPTPMCQNLRPSRQSQSHQ
jgi:hypothetical protein